MLVDFEAGGSWRDGLISASLDDSKPAIVASAGVSVYLTKDANAATLRQVAALGPGSMLAMAILLPIELANPGVRPGLKMAEKGARASGTPVVSFFAPPEILALARKVGFRDARHISAAGLTQRYLAGRTDGLRPPTNGEELLVANNSKRRGTTPLIRRRNGASLEPVNWAEAMEFFIKKFKAAWQQGHENLACYNSGQLTIEELYTFGKLWRGGLQSSNIDGNTRLCTATSATGLMANFGVDGPVASYVDVDQADLLCLYGHNVAEVQTVLWERMLAAKSKNGRRIIVADPRRMPTVRQGADLHLQLRGGTNVALINGIIHLLVGRG